MFSTCGSSAAPLQFTGHPHRRLVCRPRNASLYHRRRDDDKAGPREKIPTHCALLIKICRTFGVIKQKVVSVSTSVVCSFCESAVISGLCGEPQFISPITTSAVRIEMTTLLQFLLYSLIPITIKCPQYYSVRSTTTGDWWMGVESRRVVRATFSRSIEN